MESFRKLGIREDILKAIKDHGFEKPSEIQEKTIPPVLEGKDIIGGSATGSGKTLAFGAGILQNSEKGKGIQSLILTPTRELAEQIKRSLIQFSKYHPLNIIAVYGGVSINPQMDDLRKADVVVGTPGRILDHMQRDTINLSNIKILVLDEGDRMLDMGFIDDVQRIISQCPKQRQTLLFSATIPLELSKLSSRYMNNPIEVSAEQYVDPTKLKQIYYDIPKDVKFSLLAHLLKEEKSGLVMVFCNTRHGVDYVARNLNHIKIEAEPIHGGLSQNRRTKTLESFHSGKVYVLVCSDVAARGLDIKNVSHVYNYDIPKTSKEYIHRIGRTARAGNEGEAINLLTEDDYENMRNVLNDSSISIKPTKVPENVERIEIHRHPRMHSRGYGPRGSREHRPSGRYSRGHGSSYGRPHQRHERSEHPGYIKNPDGTYSRERHGYGSRYSHSGHGSRDSRRYSKRY